MGSPKVSLPTLMTLPTTELMYNDFDCTIVEKNLSVVILSDHKNLTKQKNIKKEKPIVRLNNQINCAYAAIFIDRCTYIDSNKMNKFFKKEPKKFNFLYTVQFDEIP